MNCMKCNRQTCDFTFRALEIQTFHVRDMTRHSKIQALGEFRDFSVCRQCAQEALSRHLNIRPAVIRTVLPFSLMIAAGLILTVLFWKGEGALRLAGLGITGCGILCMIGLLQNQLKGYRLYAGMDHEEALRRCAWECAEQQAPKKDGDNDLTYIPITEETLGRKNGDLMILYDLVPEIAVEAHKRIHADTSGSDA